MYHRRIYLKGIYVFREEVSYGRACVLGGSVTWKGMSYWKMYSSWICRNGQYHSSLDSTSPIIVEAALTLLGASLLGLDRTCEAVLRLVSIGVPIPQLYSAVGSTRDAWHVRKNGDMIANADSPLGWGGNLILEDMAVARDVSVH